MTSSDLHSANIIVVACRGQNGRETGCSSGKAVRTQEQKSFQQEGRGDE
jgi:hypothetical protein